MGGGEEKKHKKHKDKKKKEKKHHKKEKKESFEELYYYEEEKNIDSNAPNDVMPTQELSLSIQDTNKLREKLGLAPLNLESSNKVEETLDGNKKYTIEGDTFVHLPPQNWGQKKADEKLQEKLQTRRQKRELEEKLGLNKTKTLGQADIADENNALSWVQRSRQLEKEKALAAKKAKMLEELDQDFGIEDLIESNMGIGLGRKRLREDDFDEKEYSAKQLKGIKVDHSLEAIPEGDTVILTLADKNILDEMQETDINIDGTENVILQNPNLVDAEKAAKNIETRSKRPEYKPYLMDEAEMYDDFGMYKSKSLLDKYDEVIGDVPEKKTFVLGDYGIVQASQMEKDKEEQITKMRQELNMDTLETKPLNIAKEYFTHEEMAIKFKKKPSKKPKKIRSTAIIDTEEQIPETSSQTASRAENATEPEHLSIIEEDEEKTRQELEETLARIRRKKLLSNNNNANGDAENVNIAAPNNKSLAATLALIKQSGPERRVFEMVQKQLDPTSSESNELNDVEASNTILNPSSKKKPVNATSASLVLNSTSEFCRSLKQNVLKKSGPSVSETKPVKITSYDATNTTTFQNGDSSDDDENDFMGGDDDIPKSKLIKPTDTITQEPNIEKGLATALKLVTEKGYLEAPEKVPELSAEYKELKCKRYTVEDKHFDLDDKHSYKRDRYNGPIVDFKDKKDYTPDFKLNYVDQEGRLLNPKEAFRYLSHKFHGKHASKKKVEKRAKKYAEMIDKLNKTTTNDTTQNTVELLLNKQKEIRAPYLILSGKSHL